MFWNKIFLKTSLAAAIAAAILMGIGGPGSFAAQSPQIPLPGSAIPQFIDPLPLLDIQGGTVTGKMETVVYPQGPVDIYMHEFKANILPSGFIPPGILPPAVFGGTSVFGYRTAATPPAAPVDTYLGPVFVVKRGTPTEIKFLNKLGNGADTSVLAWKYSTDQTLHWADPLNRERNLCAEAAVVANPRLAPAGDCANNYGGPIPAVVHLHGGEVPPVLDGGPDAWFTSDGLVGHGYHSKDNLFPKNYAIYRYPNTQEAAPIWFHDHALGITRLNVYAGLAGGYIITDNNSHPPPADLNEPTKIIPLIIQDRMFDTNGQLFFPADSAGGVLWALNPEHPYWVPEFVGDTIVVNGKAWPFLEVGPNRYRFLFLNGSNARTYELFLINQVTGANGPPIWVVGTDGGYLDKPIKIDPALGQKLVIMPGERYDVIIDFNGFVNSTLLLRNTGRTPYPKGAPPQGSTIGRILQFRVTNQPNPSLPGAPPLTFSPTTATDLRPNNPMVRLANPITGTLAAGVTKQVTRQLTLNEVLAPPSLVNGIAYPGGPLEVLVNNTKWSGKRPDGTIPTGFQAFPGTGSVGNVYYSELPKEGNTELWEIINLTADAHPIHLHLVQFQIVNRQNINFNNYNKAYLASFPVGVAPDAYGPPGDYFASKICSPTNPNVIGGNPCVEPYLQGVVKPPAPQEAGWKDTVVVLPGQVTRLAVRWAPTDIAVNGTNLNFPFDPDSGHGYVWHCHIIDHEDNEMMRPTQVQALPVTRTYIKGIDY